MCDGGTFSIAPCLFIQTRRDHPVRLRLPPLRRRGIVCPCGLVNSMACNGSICAMAVLFQQFHVCLYRHDATTPSGCACHPSTGGELSALAVWSTFEQTRCNHPVRLRLPPLRRRGIIRPTAWSTFEQTQCNRPSVPVLDISPPKEGNCLPYRFDEFMGR